MATVVDDIYNKIKKIKAFSENGYLDHTIRAVEEYIINISKKRYYRISRRPIECEGTKKGQGRSYIFTEGAVIKYSTVGSGLDKRFAIAHELGHIALHCNHNADYLKEDTLSIVDTKKETEASFFAKSIINERSDLKTKYRDLEVEDIKEYCNSYDESLLDK